MATGLEIIKSVSSSPLNDQEAGHEYTRWSQVDLMDYLTQGIAEINNYRPDAFLVTRDVTIFTGSPQDIPTDCRLLKSVDAVGARAKSYNIGTPITQCDLQLMRTFTKPLCSPKDLAEYHVISYAYDVKNPKVFYVSPPVPVNVGASVMATFVLAPVTYTDPSAIIVLDTVYLTILKYFIAAKALEVDTESATSQAQSTALYKKFYNALGVKFSQETKFNSGMFAGQGGDNQMTKQRQP